MDLQAAVLKEHTRVQTERIIRWVGDRKERMDQVMALFLEGSYREIQRTAWIVSGIAEKKPELLEAYLPLVVDRMTASQLHPAVRRNMVRLLQFVPIPERLQGTVMNACFGYLADPSEAIAVRAFSMSILGSLAQSYPEIRQELVLLLEDMLEHQPSAAIKSRALKTIKQLQQKGRTAQSRRASAL